MRNMCTYYVATLARYVLVDSDNESDARERGYGTITDEVMDEARGFMGM